MLEIVPSCIFVVSMAALALMSALTIAPSVIFAEVICESAILAVVICESAMCAVSIPVSYTHLTLPTNREV